MTNEARSNDQGPKCKRPAGAIVLLRYVENNRNRMRYPEYRWLGLPISSASVESAMKQVNRRMKGTEKFWLEGGRRPSSS